MKKLHSLCWLTLYYSIIQTLNYTNFILVLKYVQNKDVFMIYTKAHLTRRLILGTSADSEKEENMVEWLREVGMPADFINKLSRMFQDIKVSDDLNAQFKEHLSYHPTKQTLADSVSIKILNVAAWARTTERVPVTLPRELEDYIPEVEDFYKVCKFFNITLCTVRFT